MPDVTYTLGQVRVERFCPNLTALWSLFPKDTADKVVPFQSL